ncbi:MAG: XdhC family protein [Candidatus Geothermarchaeales archaeon]
MVKIDMTDELGAEDEGEDVIGVGMPCGGTMDVYVEPYLPKPQLLIVGDGPLPRALSKLGKILDFHVVVGGSSANEQLFPEADVVKKDLGDRSWVDPRRKTYAVVATQLQTDDRILKDVLDGGVEYVALVASKTRAKMVLGYLVDRGVTEQELRKIRTPAGLDIGAKVAEEIALSIMAEVLKVRHGGTGTSLSDLKGLDLTEMRKERAGRDVP